jgi:translation machinery-associated protein 16
MNTLKKERRPGRPASTREDILRMKIAADETEYRDGFCGFRGSIYLIPTNEK